MDASSFTLFFDELKPCWPENRCRLSTPAMISARIAAPAEDQSTTERRRARLLAAKASTLPPAPVLPLACEPATYVKSVIPDAA